MKFEWLLHWFEYDNCPYDRLDPANLHFCEEQLCAWVRTPANSYSCFLIVAVGLGMLFQKRRTNIYRILAITTIVLGLLSFVAHASTSFFGQALDIGSMFLFSGLLLTHAVSRRWVVSRGKLALIYCIAVFVPFALLLAFRSHIGLILFGLEVVLIIGIELLLPTKGMRVSKKSLYFAIGSISVGFVFWILDTFRLACNPTNALLHGHVAWHVAIAMTIYFACQYVDRLDAVKG